MIIKSLEVANFRKFRDPVRIDGFTDGLNIVVEPNETGKSTLLEALRAAFFIRYSAKTELVRSYVPIGDDVAPRVAVGFELKGQVWSLEKQFMKSPSVRLTGNGSRRESEAAEEALQELLGFERGNNRGSDPETRGPLGMLWVEQAGAFAVESPNRLVRDTVRGVLEAEIGAVTGGRRFDAIRANVEAAYYALRTPASRKSRGELLAAETLVAKTGEARQRAESSLREYEQALTDLEVAKARLRIVERDLVDPETAEERRQLVEDQKLAETASLRLSAAEAQHGRAEEVANTATTRLERLDAAETRVEAADAALVEKQAAKDAAKLSSDAASVAEKALRSALDNARADRERSDDAMSIARERAQTFSRAAGARRAIDARNALTDLEKREGDLEIDVATAIDEVELGHLATLERTEIEARARFEAGTVKVEIERAAGTELRVDGHPSEISSADVLSVTRFEFGQAGSLTVTPPQGSGRSLDADLAVAREEVARARRNLGVESYSAGVARNERAAAAGRELKALHAQIAAACPGDPTIGLAPGVEALRTYVAELGDEDAEACKPIDDLLALEEALACAKLAEATATGLHEEARAVLSIAETVLATAVAELSSGAREAEAASEELQIVREQGDRATLDAARAKAQRDRTAMLEAFERAQEGSNAFNLPAIARRLENIDRAAIRCGQEQLELTARIAALESRIQPTTLDNRQQPQAPDRPASSSPSFPVGNKVLRHVEIAREHRLRDMLRLADRLDLLGLTGPARARGRPRRTRAWCACRCCPPRGALPSSRGRRPAPRSYRSLPGHRLSPRTISFASLRFRSAPASAEHDLAACL
jgi:hypothetical protein